MRTIAQTCVIVLIATACSRSHEERGPDATPLGLTGSGRSQCQSDAECPITRLGRPADGTCAPRHPSPSYLVASAGEGGPVRQCELGPIFFEFNSTMMTPEGRAWLGYNIACLKEQDLQGVFIEGHADARGSAAYNDDLSRRRAQTVAAYLRQRGVDTPVTVRALGEIPGPHWRLSHSERPFVWLRRVELRVK